MKKISVILIGIVVLTVGLLSIPKEEKKVLVEELNNKNTTLAFYIEGENGNYTESNTIPSTGYTLNTEKSICTNNTTPVWSDNKLYLDNLQNRGTSCYLYFDEKGITNFQELIVSKTLATRTDFSTTLTEDTTGTVYYADTSKGRTYYFAGNPTDNWVYFGGFYWRIIRINEDGTIRMIYQGTRANATGEGTQIGTSAFNSPRTDNMYVGYMYQSNQVHGLTNSSAIKEFLDQWYHDNLLTDYDEYIDGNAGFCGDRVPSTSRSSINNSGGTGISETYYGYIRLITYKEPTFECGNSSDLYTINGSSVGNGALTYPIGLISADEVAFAGGVVGINNTGYYLYTVQDYWTMSPCAFFATNNTAHVFRIWSDGDFSGNYVDNSYGIRPVINLKANITISGGNGSSSNPYIIEGA